MSLKMTRTFEIRIVDTKDKKYLLNYIFKYRHWQNILTLLVINLFKANNKDYKYFLDYEIVRACISDTDGSKNKSDKIAYIKENYKDNTLYKDLITIGKQLKVHNLSEIVKRFKKDFSNYFITLKDYKKNPEKYEGLPQLPRPKKLSKINQYSIPLDSYASISLKKLEKRHLLGINLSSKMRYFYLGKNIELFKNTKSLKVKYQNNQIYLQFSYELDNLLTADFKPQKYAGLDIGLNNVVSLFIDDKETPSLIIDGANYKYYNYRYNKLISKLDKTIANEAIEFKTSKTDTKYPVKWTEKGMYLKKFKTYLTQKRNEYFKSNFHKLSKKIVEYLQLHDVNHLAISSSLAELKNNGKCNLRKSTKQNFIQIPFIKLLQYIEEKCHNAGIKVTRVDETYTSKTSCISSDVFVTQAYSNGVINNERSREESACNGKRIKRGLFKDTAINKAFNADLNGAVNHIKLVIRKSFTWLKDNLWKLANPIKLKSAGELHRLLCNIRSNKSLERRTTACAYRYPN